MTKAVPGHSGGELLGRSRARGAREGEDEEEVRKMQHEVMNVILA